MTNHIYNLTKHNFNHNGNSVVIILSRFNTYMYIMVSNIYLETSIKQQGRLFVTTPSFCNWLTFSQLNTCNNFF